MSRDSASSVMGITLAASAVLMVTMGVRQSMGLFVSPINTATGLGLATVSFAMAVAQFAWGLAQPVAGAIADRYGPGRVIVSGILILALGTAIIPLTESSWWLVFSIGLLAAIGSGAGSFSVLIGAAAQRMRADQRGMASGIINAGGSFGQVVFAPLAQKLISALGWMGALWTLALVSLAALPFVWPLRRRPQPPASAAATPVTITPDTTAANTSTVTPAPRTDQGLRAAVREALADRSYWLLHAGFFTCGFHVAFLVTHLPGEVQLCGLPATVASWSLAIIGAANVIGSLVAGAVLTRVRAKYVLFWMYLSRSLIILIYLAAPKTAMTFYVFAFALGLTWLATVPPTAGVVAKLFGPRYLATLFGLTLLSHQIGGFLGAWLGGLAMEGLGSYNAMWYADIALSALAALVNLPIREAPVEPRLQPAT